MGDIISKLFGGSLLGGVKDIIGSFKLDPAKKAELQAIVDQNAALIQQKELELQAKAMDLEAEAMRQQGENIRAEATSEDAFVRRARPAFLWMMTLCIGMSVIVFPIINICRGGGIVFPQIPDAYLQLFGIGFLGYTGARSWEKIKGTSKE